MPIWLRKYTYHLIAEFLKKSNPESNAEDSWVKGKPNQKLSTIDPKQYASTAYNAIAKKK